MHVQCSVLNASHNRSCHSGYLTTLFGTVAEQVISPIIEEDVTCYGTLLISLVYYDTNALCGTISMYIILEDIMLASCGRYYFYIMKVFHV